MRSGRHTSRRASSSKTDCGELEAEAIEVKADCRHLEAEVGREGKARTKVDPDLKRAQDRIAALQHQLWVARAQLEHGGPQAEQRPWWGQLGS
jgi:hypothetical protein